MRYEHIPELDDGELCARLLQIHKRNEGRAMKPIEPEVRSGRILLAILIGSALLLLAGVLWITDAFAQTPCTATSTTACFDASVKSGPAPLASTLVWSVPGASACTAGGAGNVPAWTGSVPTSGTRNLTSIGVDFTLTLTCTGPGKTKLDWIAPTTNADGTALTDLAGYTILWGASAATLTNTAALNVPAATTYTILNLTPGSYAFAVRAKNAAGAESVNSNVITKAVAGLSYAGSVSIDVSSVPSPPTSLSVTETTAFEIRPSSTGVLIASRIGLVPVGTRCYADERKVGTATYNGVPIELVDFVNWPAASVLREAFARCGA